jgi:hypothetical protein
VKLSDVLMEDGEVATSSTATEYRQKRLSTTEIYATVALAPGEGGL